MSPRKKPTDDDELDAVLFAIDEAFKEAGDVDACSICGCTERDPCEGGCGWVAGEVDLCSQCEKKPAPAPLDERIRIEVPLTWGLLSQFHALVKDRARRRKARSTAKGARAR